MRLSRTLLLAALLAAPALVAGCELTPDLGSRDMRMSSDESTLDELIQRLETCRMARDDLKQALQAGDEAGVKPARRGVLRAKGKMEDRLNLVQARKPEFPDRDLQLRYLDEVYKPWVALRKEIEDLMRAKVPASAAPPPAPEPGPPGESPAPEK